MKKKINNKKKIILAFLALLFLSIISDISRDGILKDGYIERGETGEQEEEVQLEVNVDGILKDYPYSVEMMPSLPTKEEADAYFEKTIARIDADFAQIGEVVPLKSDYFDAIVKADWIFIPFGIVDSDGKVRAEKLDAKETLMQAQVELHCGTYERIYEFSFLLPMPKLSEEELVLQEIEKNLEQQMLQEGTTQVLLPTEVNGTAVKWSENKEYITPQILFIEIVALVLSYVISKRKKAEDEKIRIQKMEEEYPDIVNQLALLLGAGMTTRQAWGRIATQYSFKKKAGMLSPRPVYEAILSMNGRLMEGVSERIVYQQFLEEIPVACYRKLMRMLLGNLEKGSQGICLRLEEESRLAFEQRVLLVKKRGEEASTKMLLPLMLMLMIVMGIVMLPALIEFKV